jgi:hypothetical protein
MTDPLNALRRSSGKSSSGLKPERAAPSVHSATRRRVGGVAVNVARDADGAVPQQVSHRLDVHAAFQPAHGDRVAQRVHAHTVDAGRLGGYLNDAQQVPAVVRSMTFMGEG